MNNYWIDHEDLDPFGESEGMNDYYPEEDYYGAEGDMSEFLAEYESDMFDDSAELAEVLREVLHDDYQQMPTEELQETLTDILETMTPAEGISFKKVLRQISKAGEKALKDPTLGQVVGTIVGGPLGTAIAGQALSGGGKPSSAPTPSQTAPASPTGGSAATQIAALTQNEDFIKGLVALGLGELGKKSIPIGKDGQSMQVAAIPELLLALAGKAAKEAEELLSETAEPAYLLDSEGNYRVDPADLEGRAEALYEALFDAENERLADEAELYAAYLEYDDEFEVDDYEEEALEDFRY